jgi:hypothetical protein
VGVRCEAVHSYFAELWAIEVFGVNLVSLPFCIIAFCIIAFCRKEENLTIFLPGIASSFFFFLTSVTSVTSVAQFVAELPSSIRLLADLRYIY